MATATCAVCGLMGSHHCSICRNVKYCSRACQKKDWSHHKATCAPPDAPPPLVRVEAHPGLEHIVYVIYDKSGSMDSFIPYVDRELTKWQAREGLAARLQFIPFSDTAMLCHRVEDMPTMKRSTNIASAFSVFTHAIAKAPPHDASVVFISDGVDDMSYNIVSRLNDCFRERPPAKTRTCALFAVAVGNSFPTGTFVDALRCLSKDADRSLPLLFPVALERQVPAVFEELAVKVFETNHTALPPVVLTNSSPLADIERHLRETLHDLVIAGVARTATPASVLEAVAASRVAVGRVDAVLAVQAQAQAHAEAAKAAGMTSAARRPVDVRPLATVRLAKVLGARLGGGGQVTHGLALEVLTKANEMKSDAKRGRMMSQLSDADKQKALVFGRYIDKAAALRPADFTSTVDALKHKLSLYGSPSGLATPLDRDAYAADLAVTDTIHLFTQREGNENAATVLADIQACSSVVELLSVVPLIGRAVHVRTCDGTQINPYLFTVTAVTQIVKTMTVADLTDRYGGEYSHGAAERANCLVLPFSTLQAEPIGVAVANFMLLKTTAVQDKRAVPALLAGLVAYLLAQDAEWARSEMAEWADSIARAPFIASYVQALVENPVAAMGPAKADSSPLCEHPNKWLLAVLAAHRRGLTTGWSAFKLRELMKDFLVETLRRAGRTLLDVLAGGVEMPSAEDLLAEVPGGVDTSALRECDAVSDFAARAAKAITADLLMSRVRVREVPEQVLGHEEGTVVVTFRNMARLMGLNPVELRALTSDERIEVLCLAENKASTNYGRLVRHIFAAKRAKEALDQAGAHASAQYVARSSDAHAGAATLFPLDWASRFERERGLAEGSLWARFEVNPETLLSRNACGSPACPHFLRVLGKPLPASKAPRMRDLLRQHMSAFKPLPSFHCAIQSAVARDDLPDVCEALAAGQYLKPESASRMAALSKYLQAHPPTLANAEAVFDAYADTVPTASGVGGPAYEAWAAALDGALDGTLDGYEAWAAPGPRPSTGS